VWQLIVPPKNPPFLVKEAFVKKRQMIYMLVAAMAAGGIGGALLSPSVVRAADKYIIDLVNRTTDIQQSQKEINSSLDTKYAVLKTLIEQQADSNAKLGMALAAVQKSVQDMQANSGAQLNSTATQVSGITDNLTDMQQRFSKLNAQLADIQGTLQSLDAKISALSQPAALSNPAVNPGPGTVPGGSSAVPPVNTAPSPSTPAAGSTPPPSAENLYDSALHDISTNKYDLAQTEFQDYLKYYPKTDYASNAVFYLGEIAYVQKRYPEAIDRYSDVISNFPNSFKLGPALYKRGMTYIAMGKKTEGIADLREVIRHHANSDEDRAARAKLHEMNVPIAAGGR
jgi:tol-pal system protein YbgF